MARSPTTISAENFDVGTTQSIAELHISGGIRATQDGEKLWSWYPVLRDQGYSQLKALPINKISQMACLIDETLFGGDQQNDVDKQLISRSWTPLDGPVTGMQPADMWSSIASNALDAGEQSYSTLARHIAFSIHAAGIRLRDASDGYQAQLFGAIESRRKSGERFSNIPMADLYLAFHSVLSELASARDYIATALADRIGAPSRIDAMNRFVDWLSASSRASYRNNPVIKEMLEAHEPSSANPWLHRLTEYRNTFLHRRPLGSTESVQFLRYSIVEKQRISFPKIELPLADSDPFASGQDALKNFIGLYREMTKLARLAANHSPFDASPPLFVVQ